MCGFCGIVNQTKLELESEVLENMLDRIQHRGPDSAGYFRDDYCQLGFRRLAIIDLSQAGNQPFYSQDERYVMVFNGEIYNYHDIKEDLLAKGYEFISTTDSEVIIRGFEEWGSQVFARLRGMFAIAIWDRQERTLSLARDQFGIKPLYYTKNTQDHSILFASEIKSFLDYPLFIESLNQDALRPYLMFQYNPMNETFFKGVYHIPQGSYLKFKDGELVEQFRFAEVDFRDEYEDQSRSQEETKTAIKDALIESIEYHKIADVPVGSFLSGGVDSSLITSLCNPVKTYSVGFENPDNSKLRDPQFDETAFSAQLSEHLSIENASYYVSSQEALEALPEILYHLDEPDANYSCIPLWFLNKLAAQDVRVVLSGEGADELFAGYTWYKPSKMEEKVMRHLPKSLRKGLVPYADKKGQIGRIGQMAKRSLMDVSHKFMGQSKVFEENDVNEVLQASYRKEETPYDLLSAYYEEFRGQSDLNQMQSLDLRVWNPHDILQKADKMSMAHSLELRTPFLDKEMYHLARTLKNSERVNYETTKVALRQVAQDVLPEEWAKRPKLGFPTPVRKWMQESNWYHEMEERFTSETAQEFFEVGTLLNLLKEHQEGKADHGHKLYVCYAFLVWYQRFFEQTYPCIQEI